MKYQRGGPVNGWIVAALLATALASAAMNIYQSRHRTIAITFPTSASRPTGIIPRYADTCGSLGAICYFKI